jgi:hypothetical protein
MIDALLIVFPEAIEYSTHYIPVWGGGEARKVLPDFHADDGE